MVKRRESSASHKKVFVETFDGRTLPGYIAPAHMDGPDGLELMNVNGEVERVELERVRAVYFVNDFEQRFLPSRKSFLSRPKLDGLWVRVKYRDEDTLEGGVSNDLLALLDRGVHLIPPDPGTNCGSFPASATSADRCAPAESPIRPIRSGSRRYCPALARMNSTASLTSRTASG